MERAQQFRKEETYNERNNINNNQEKNKNKHNCKVCHKKFANKYSLRVHERSFHKVLPFACEKCPNKYTNAIDLRRHKLKDHILLTFNECESLLPQDQRQKQQISNGSDSSVDCSTIFNSTSNTRSSRYGQQYVKTSLKQVFHSTVLILSKNDSDQSQKQKELKGYQQYDASQLKQKQFVNSNDKLINTRIDLKNKQSVIKQKRASYKEIYNMVQIDNQQKQERESQKGNKKENQNNQQ